MHMIPLKKAFTLTLGGLLMGGLVVAPSLAMLELDTAQVRIVDRITMDAWNAHRAAHVDEDMPGWDCRIDGNMECGAPDNATYALSCTTYAVTSSLCALERRPLK